MHFAVVCFVVIFNFDVFLHTDNYPSHKFNLIFKLCDNWNKMT